MKTYYNEFDKKKCAALKALMEDGHISQGDIDDRPIQEVQPNDLQGYTRCHFFAGIGLWDYALDLAGWGDGPVWTGSCPCQPFSSAGRQKGKTDDRHLWPEWLRLIRECSPATIFGEQVASAVAYGWLDDVYQGLEAQDYAVGAVVLPACSVGAPHRRERLWFVTKSSNDRPQRVGSQSKGATEQIGLLCRTASECSTMGNAEHNGSSTPTLKGSNGQAVFNNTEGKDCSCECEGTSDTCNVAYAERTRPQGHGRLGEVTMEERRQRTQRYPWQSGVWLNCPDGKQRLVEPRIPLLAHGYPERVGVIHSAGDAIVPQVAAEVIKAFLLGWGRKR